MLVWYFLHSCRDTQWNIYIYTRHLGNKINHTVIHQPQACCQRIYLVIYQLSNLAQVNQPQTARQSHTVIYRLQTVRKVTQYYTNLKLYAKKFGATRLSAMTTGNRSWCLHDPCACVLSGTVADGAAAVSVCHRPADDGSKKTVQTPDAIVHVVDSLGEFDKQFLVRNHNEALSSPRAVEWTENSRTPKRRKQLPRGPETKHGAVVARGLYIDLSILVTQLIITRKTVICEHTAASTSSLIETHDWRVWR